MLGRIVLSLIVAAAVVTAPAAPLEIAKLFSPKKKCCSFVQINRDPCRGCPMTPASSSSTCCSAQAPCFVGYSQNSNDEFLAGLSGTALASVADDRISVRVQRPPVPPPRGEFS